MRLCSLSYTPVVWNHDRPSSLCSVPASQPAVPATIRSIADTPPPPGSPLPRTVSVACTVCAQTVQRFATGDRVAAAEAASMTGPPSCRRTAVAERARWSPEVGSVSPNVGKITGFWPFSPQSGKSHSEQINFYSSDHHLCFPDQHGFRTDHSTPPTLHCSHWLTMYVHCTAMHGPAWSDSPVPLGLSALFRPHSARFAAA